MYPHRHQCIVAETGYNMSYFSPLIMIATIMVALEESNRLAEKNNLLRNFLRLPISFALKEGFSCQLDCKIMLIILQLRENENSVSSMMI